MIDVRQEALFRGDGNAAHYYEANPCLRGSPGPPPGERDGGCAEEQPRLEEPGGTCWQLSESDQDLALTSTQGFLGIIPPKCVRHIHICTSVHHSRFVDQESAESTQLLRLAGFAFFCFRGVIGTLVVCIFRNEVF